MDYKERFIAKALPLICSLVEPLGFTLSQPVGNFSPDPKGAGFLHIVTFRSSQAQLLIRTRDGATEILVGSLEAKVGWQDVDWFYPACADSSQLKGIPSGEQLRAIATQLDLGRVAWY
jgi:hypothetical protein